MAMRRTSGQPHSSKPFSNLCVRTHSQIEELLVKEGESMGSSNLEHSLNCHVPLVWREKVASWLYDVADHLGEARSIVYVAMNILDRYCLKLAKEMSIDEVTYEVASMASLFLSVRIAGSGNLRVSQLVPMSRRGLKMQDVVTTGTAMISCLNWDKRVVTPYEFLPAMLQAATVNNDASTRHSTLETAAYLIEISAFDGSLSGTKPSHLAFAALLQSIALQSSEDDAIKFSGVVTETTGFPGRSSDIMQIRSVLGKLYMQSADNSHSSKPCHVIVGDDEDNQDFIIPVRQGLVRTVSEDDLTSPCLKRSHSAQYDLQAEIGCKRRRIGNH